MSRKASRVVTIVLLGLLAGGWKAAAADEKPTPPEGTRSSPAQGETQGPAERRPALTSEQRADLFMARKSYAEAVDFYRRALHAEGRNRADLWTKLGVAYQDLSNNSAARNAYKRAIKLDKSNAEAWNNIGTTYYLENRIGKSLKYYRQAIKLKPSNAPFHMNLGTSLYHQKKIEQAVEEYRTALELDPGIFSERSSGGTVMQARGADAKFYFYMAKVLAGKGRAEEAVRYLRRAFEDGFHDTKLLDEDKDFKKISDFPAYVELRANPPKAIGE
ncbi:MAG: tetratricopeptide repeat protein [Acidobacteriia bacterium]|nr:tetratricopeptide repeat protein [Terriglobia bacterium]